MCSYEQVRIVLILLGKQPPRWQSSAPAHRGGYFMSVGANLELNPTALLIATHSFDLWKTLASSAVKRIGWEYAIQPLAT